MGRGRAYRDCSCTIAVKAQTLPDSESFPDADDHFKYGSIGTEEGVGLPYWIWKVLPTVFEDKLPKRPGVGWERIGFLVDAKHPRPMGTSYKSGRVARVGLNCATCHVGTYRESPTSPRQVVAGMPANNMDLQGYANFLTACANDPRFNYGTLMAAIRKENPEIGWFDRLIYKLVRRRCDEEGHPRARARQRLVRQAAAVRSRPCRYLQSLQGHPEDSHRRRGGDGRSAVALEPAHAGADVAALGREQRFGRRAEQERGHRRRRDARLARSRLDEANRELDPRSQAAGVPRGSH